MVQSLGERDFGVQIACQFPLNFRYNFKDLMKRYRLLFRGDRVKIITFLQILRYNFRKILTSCHHCVIHISSRIFIKTLSLSRVSPARHSLLTVLYQNKLRRENVRDIFTDIRTQSVQSNSFIEALHVLHETLATNNCFPAKACWHFLISKAHHPVEITPVTQVCLDVCFSERTKGERFDEGEEVQTDRASRLYSSIIDTLLWLQSIQSLLIILRMIRTICEAL